MQKKHSPAKPDMTCVPYKKKVLYYSLMLPFVGVLTLVFIHLWTINPLLSLSYLGFYFVMCFFQVYCCAYKECPYMGGFCPSLSGLFPSGFIAKLYYAYKPVKKSTLRFRIHTAMGALSWLGIAVFPLKWLIELGSIIPTVYVSVHIVYIVTFALTICKSCALRDTCPGGKMQKRVFRRGRSKNQPGQMGK